MSSSNRLYAPALTVFHFWAHVSYPTIVYKCGKWIFEFFFMRKKIFLHFLPNVFLTSSWKLLRMWQSTFLSNFKTANIHGSPIRCSHKTAPLESRFMCFQPCLVVIDETSLQKLLLRLRWHKICCSCCFIFPETWKVWVLSHMRLKQRICKLDLIIRSRQFRQNQTLIVIYVDAMRPS